MQMSESVKKPQMTSSDIKFTVTKTQKNLYK